MTSQFSDQLRYAAAAGALVAVAWGYRKRKEADSSENSASHSTGIPSFRSLEAEDVRQLREGSVHRIDDGNCSDGLICEVAVLGSACGGGMPSLSCLLNSEHRCPVCAGADKRNQRTPQSVMLRISSPESDESFAVLLDCSQAVKRQMCITWSLFGQIRLDAVMLTAGHVDKFLGLNDLREVQHASQKDSRSGSGETLPIYASGSTLETVKSSMPYLFSEKKKTKTLVAGLAARSVSEELGERVSMSPDVSVTVRSLPGTDEQLGFVFGRDEGCVVVLPDPNISPNAREWLSERDVNLLIIGNVANRDDLSTCAQLVKAVKPRHATITGLSCALDHAAAEDLLQTEVGEFSVSVAYDGMKLEARIADDDLWRTCSGECSCLSNGSTATGGASSGGDSMTDEDRYIGLSPTHGPAEAAAMDCTRETTAALPPVSISELAEGPPGPS